MGAVTTVLRIIRTILTLRALSVISIEELCAATCDEEQSTTMKRTMSVAVVRTDYFLTTAKAASCSQCV